MVRLGACFFAALAAGAGAQPMHTGEPDDPGPIVRNLRDQFREFTLISQVQLLTPNVFIGAAARERVMIDVERASIVHPVPPTTAWQESLEGTFTGQLFAEGRVVDAEPRRADGYQGGTVLGVWEVFNLRARDLRLEVRTEAIIFETEIDEPRAAQIPWPEDNSVFDAETLALLQPQLFIESDDARFASLVERWTNGRSREVTPYVLAKSLAARVIESYQPNGALIATDPKKVGGIDVISGSLVPSIYGFDVAGAIAAAENGGGPPLDLANLLCAVYRAAGLPTRLVVGVDLRESDNFDFFMPTAWVEFALYNPEREVVEWIPVDIIAQRNDGNRAPPLDRPWRFFGNNERSEDLVALSFHWHPPTTVVNAGAPALWGWLPEPNIPPVTHLIGFTPSGRQRTVETLKEDQEIWVRRTGTRRTG
ncbi:MAG: transglutaminase domain-containing protein [Planctomycetota bacterium]